MIFIGNYYNNELGYKFIKQAKIWYHPKYFQLLVFIYFILFVINLAF